MDRDEFRVATEQLGKIVVKHTARTFPDMSQGGLQWNVLKIFGILAPLEVIESECTKVTSSPCPECWSELPHGYGGHDFSIKEKMADMLLGLEAAIHDSRY